MNAAQAHPRARTRLPKGAGHAWLGPALGAALAVFAYRPLVLGSLSLPSRYEVERWFFGPDEFSPLFAVGIAGWLLYRRLDELRTLPARRDLGMAVPFLVVGVVCFVWAELTRAAHLLLPSLAANLLAFSGFTRGRAGCRAAALPAVVLLLGVPIPAPLRNELVWQLQLWTAGGTAWVMEMAGQEIDRGGILLRSSDGTFLVIEACSGLRGIQVLTLVALLVRDLFRSSGARQWLLVLVAPLLGFGLNIVRVVLIASSEDPAALGAGETGDHTAQGLAVSLAGTALLYAGGRGLAGLKGPRPRAAEKNTRVRGLPRPGWLAACAWLTVLGGLSLTIPPFSVTDAPLRAWIDFPESAKRWSSEDLDLDPLFVGYHRQGHTLYRRYEMPQRRGPARVVYLFVGLESIGAPEPTFLSSSKLAHPNSDWSIEQRDPVRLWTLRRDADLAEATDASGSRYAVVYSWRLRHEGLLRESLRSLLALESSPFRRETRRAAVRLVAPFGHDGPLVRDWAKQSLDRFIDDFEGQLASL